MHLNGESCRRQTDVALRRKAFQKCQSDCGMSHIFRITTFSTAISTLNMMLTSMQRIGKSAKTPLASIIDQAFARQAKSALSTATTNHFSGLSVKSTPMNAFAIQVRPLSLQALDMAAVRQIKAELMEVDANSDGRYARY